MRTEKEMPISVINGEVSCSSWSHETGRNQQHSVYVLRDPSTLDVRYVGLSVSPENRKRGHQSFSRKSGLPVDTWKKRLSLSGKSAVFEIIEQTANEKDGARAERRWIAFYAAIYGPRLLNRQWHPQFVLSGRTAGKRLRFIPS